VSSTNERARSFEEVNGFANFSPIFPQRCKKICCVRDIALIPTNWYRVQSTRLVLGAPADFFCADRYGGTAVGKRGPKPAPNGNRSEMIGAACSRRPSHHNARPRMPITPQILDLEREIEALVKRAGDSLRQPADRRPRAGAGAVPDQGSPSAQADSNTAEQGGNRS